MIKVNIGTSEIYKVINLKGDCENFVINYISNLDELADNSLFFFKKKLDNVTLKKYHEIKRCIFIVKDDIGIDFIGENNYIIKHDNPRFAIAKILSYIEENSLYLSKQSCQSISEKADVSQQSVIKGNVCIEDNVRIEPFCFIGDDVIIKKGTIIKTGAKIIRRTIIGENCLIRENSVIGGNGFGIEEDDNGNNYRVPQLGGVIIGDNVEIGALNTVCSGTISPTSVGNYVKTDDHIHIAHNVSIGDNSIITAGVIFSGTVNCGSNVWVGINSSIIQKISIGNNSLIGIGAVVTNNISPDTTVAGSPARDINIYKKINNAIKKLIQ